MQLTKEQRNELTDLWQDYNWPGPKNGQADLSLDALALDFSEWIDADPVDRLEIAPQCTSGRFVMWQ